jgi:hypothetical protein
MKTTLPFRLIAVVNLLSAAAPVQAALTALVPPAAAPADLAQFTSGGHVLGFTDDGMYAATGTHALHVDFAGANRIRPQSDMPAGEQGRAAPLGRVTYENLWDGIDLAYTAGADVIYTTTYTVAPGANPADIRLTYNAPVTVNEDGTLSIAYETGTLTESAPIAWQEIDGERTAVDIAFRVRGQEVSFELGTCNPDYPLTIDPSLNWNTFLGGSGNDTGYGIALDSSRNVYVTGSSDSTWGSPVRAYTAGTDAFAAKLDSSGNLIRSTFLGGSGNESGQGIALDDSGNLYVTGAGNASWAGPVRAHSGGDDAFAAKVDFALPADFSKTAPGNASYASTNPTLSWSASYGADSYEYCIDIINNNDCDSAWISTGTSTSVSLSGLGNNDTYYWLVSAVKDVGVVYADSGTWFSFTARNQTFADVPIDHSLWQYIEAFYSSGITGGCGFDPLIFCPANNVTRAAMAVFLLRAKYGAGYAPPAATHTFADLPVAGKEWQEAWVDQFYLEGITSGCGTSPLRYCPENPVTRAAMAVFILRTLEGPSYTPPAASHFFADLPVAGKEWMEPWVDEVYRRGITTGCGTGPLIFCPETAVKRQAMAAFIVRAFNLPLP